MDQELIEVARDGNIDALYELLARYPTILDEKNFMELNNNPLHWAVLGGHTSFVVEIATLKPSFTKMLNHEGYSPLHLASINGHQQIVTKFMEVDRTLCTIKGREGRTPLHCAVINGHIEVVKVLLLYRHRNIEDLTHKGETAFHLALKYDQIGVFKALVDMIYMLGMLIYHYLLGCTDEEGNTVLHLAISRRNHEVVELLLMKGNIFVRSAVKVNEKNKEELTALDLLESHFPNTGEDQERVERILRGAHERQTRIALMISWNLNLLAVFVRYFIYGPNDRIQARNDLLVVAVLVVTATYQTVITPPGGLWQDDNTNSSTATSAAAAAVVAQNPNHKAGDPILATTSPVLFGIVILSNGIGFALSSFLLFQLAPEFPYRLPLLIALLCMVFTCMLWGGLYLALLFLVLGFLIGSVLSSKKVPPSWRLEEN